MSGAAGRAREAIRAHLKISGPAVLLTIAGFAVADQFVEPAPPGEIAIASGGTEGAYFGFAQRYREIFAREGITLVVRETAGSIENLQLLEDPESGVDIAFVQGGTAGPAVRAGLVGLASLYYEPLWIFYRGFLRQDRLDGLEGRRVAVGRVGSGTRAVALRLLDDAGVSETMTLLELGGAEAKAALLEGHIDAAFFIASPEAETVRDLLAAPGVRLMSFDRAQALAKRHPFLSVVTLPAGAIDLAADIPPADTTLVAPAATLVARADLHPALIDLFLMAATRIHGKRGLFADAGAFPSARYLEFPLDGDAERFLKNGPSFLQRYFPFWAATLIDRLKVMLLPLLILLIPLARVVPPIYQWRMRARVYRWYKELEALEAAVRASRTDEEKARCRADLDRVEAALDDLHVPLGHAHALYDLKLHLALVRERLLGRESPPTTGDSPPP